MTLHYPAHTPAIPIGDPLSDAEFRRQFLTTCVWEKLSPPATPIELSFAMTTRKPTTTPMMAIADCNRRRKLASRGRLRELDRTAAAERDSL